MDRAFDFVAKPETSPPSVPQRPPEPRPDVPATPHPATALRRDRIGMRCVTVHVKRDLHRKLRLLSIHRDQTITEIIRECLEREVEHGLSAP